VRLAALRAKVIEWHDSMLPSDPPASTAAAAAGVAAAAGAGASLTPALSLSDELAAADAARVAFLRRALLAFGVRDAALGRELGLQLREAGGDDHRVCERCCALLVPGGVSAVVRVSRAHGVCVHCRTCGAVKAFAGPARGVVRRLVRRHGKAKKRAQSSEDSLRKQMDDAQRAAESFVTLDVALPARTLTTARGAGGDTGAAPKSLRQPARHGVHRAAAADAPRGVHAERRDRGEKRPAPPGTPLRQASASASAGAATPSSSISGGGGVGGGGAGRSARRKGFSLAAQVAQDLEVAAATATPRAAAATPHARRAADEGAAASSSGAGAATPKGTLYDFLASLGVRPS
jgi:RNase P subunit RPR2